MIALPTQALRKVSRYIEKHAEDAFEKNETDKEVQGVLEFKLSRAIDQKELIGVIFREHRERASRVYFRIGE